MNKIKARSEKREVRSDGGQIIILNTLIFFLVSLIIIFAISSPVISSLKTTSAFMKSNKSFHLANSATEESIYRLFNGFAISGTEYLELNDSTAEINISEITGGKNVTITSSFENFFKNLAIELEEGEGVSFNYGLQTGQGGFEMSGGAGVYGNVYSNGDIIGSGGPFITGSAVSATVSLPEAIISNDTTPPPSTDVAFGGNSTSQDVAQSFVAEDSGPISSVKVYIRRTGTAWMNNINVRLVADSGGKPATSSLASGTIGYTSVTTNYNYLTVPFGSQINLDIGETYWIVFDTSTTWGQNYELGANQDEYNDGSIKEGTWNTKSKNNVWNDFSFSNADILFSLFSGGDTGLISGITVGQQGGDAWANTVNNSNIYGDLYCQSGSGNNKTCNTSRPDPVEQPMPISDGNIEDWKNEAESGGIISGNYNLGSADIEYLGPKKIEGNLNIGAGAILYVTGTIYVTGNISLSGGGKINLSSGFGSNSGVIISDGRIDVSGGGQFNGSGTSGSYILVVSTSQCPYSGSCNGNPAIDASGGTGSVVLNAQQGDLELSGGASAKQLTAKKIIMSGGTTVHYETGLTDITFESGPSGGWNISSWQEVE